MRGSSARLAALGGLLALGSAFRSGHTRSSRAALLRGARLRASAIEPMEAAPPVYWFSGFELSSRAKEFDRGVDAINRQVDGALEMLEEITQDPFFSLYSVDMLASCAYLVQDVDECSLQECECLPCDDDEVPAYMLERDSEEFEFALDGWARWDMPTDAYYDLRAYPEAYTRYNGTQVWEFIHRKLCFKGVASWKRDFNRAVGGLHSAISGQVVRSMDEEGEHEFALREYRRRLREQPGAVENLYYGAMLLLNACNEASERLVAYDYGEPKVNEQLSQLLAIPLLCGGCVGAAQNNLRRHASWQGGVGLWQARLRARDLMRIMNCVQCSVCRLHGKVGTLGVNTGMQILLGQEGRGGDAARMHRVEVAALITTLRKFLSTIQTVRRMEAELAAAGLIGSGEPTPMGGFDGEIDPEVDLDPDRPWE